MNWSPTVLYREGARVTHLTAEWVATADNYNAEPPGAPWAVAEGISGYRCHDVAEFVAAVDMVNKLDHQEIADHAERFSLSEIAPRYDAYLRGIR